MTRALIRWIHATGAGYVPGMAEYVSTTQAAKAVGVSVRSLQRWVADGQLEPDFLTPGGHARWDVERLRRELVELSKRRSRDR